MNAEQSRKLIEAAGGNKAFAMQLGLDVADPKYAARISQWKRRGIPPRIQLDKVRELGNIRSAAVRRGAL